jgi:hypothetical protein
MKQSQNKYQKMLKKFKFLEKTDINVCEIK